MHCELAEYERAKEQIATALNDLRERQRRDRKSLWILSRRAWAQFLDRAAEMGTPITQAKAPRKTGAWYEDWPLEFKAAKSDPWDELNHVEEGLAEARRKKSEKTFDVKPHFDAGTYTEQGNGTHFQSWTVVPPNYTLHRLVEAVGIPIEFGWATVLKKATRDAVALEFEPSTIWYFRLFRTLHGHDDELVERFFSRVAVARMPKEIIVALVERLSNAIEFWRFRIMETDPATGQRKFATGPVDEIRWQLEVLSRLAIRLDSKRARQLYDLALDIIKDPNSRHWQLFAPINDLLQRTSEAMPRDQRADLILPALEFPLQSEIGFNGPHHDWPAPLFHIADCLLKKPADKTKWNMRLQQLIQAVRTEQQPSRADAAMRLCYLDHAKLLSPTERKAYGHALWSQPDPRTGLPISTNFAAHTFLNLPAPDPNVAARYFTDTLFKMPAHELLNDVNLLMAITGAATPTDRRSEPLRPSREEALRILDAIIALKPVEQTLPRLFDANMLKRAIRQLGTALARAIMPVLQTSDYTETRIEALFRQIDTGVVSSAIEALPFLVSVRPELEERAVTTIRRAIVSRNPEEIRGAAIAIKSWLSLPEEAYRPLPASISDQVVAAIANRRETNLAPLMWCARSMLKAGSLTAANRSSLVEALRDLFDETTYGLIELGSRRELLLSSLRIECVKLARQLSALGVQDKAIADWIEVGQTDPLPEVRWAFADDRVGD